MKRKLFLILVLSSLLCVLCVSAFAGEKEDLQAKQGLIQQAMLKVDQEYQTQMAMREKAISDLVAAQAKIDQLKADFTMLQGKLKEIADKLGAFNKPPEPEKKK